MVHVRVDGNALTGSQAHLGAGRNDHLSAVHMDMNVIYLIKVLILCGIVYTDQNISAAAVDDVLHLGPVEVHRRILSFFDIQEFFRVGFCIFVLHFQVSVPDRDQGEPDFIKITETVVCDIPA